MMTDQYVFFIFSQLEMTIKLGIMPPEKNIEKITMFNMIVRPRSRFLEIA